MPNHPLFILEEVPMTLPTKAQILKAINAQRKRLDEAEKTGYYSIKAIEEKEHE